MNSFENSKRLSTSLLDEHFWAEFDSVSEIEDPSQPYSELDDQSSPNKSLESIAEADWLKQVGLQDIVESIEGDSMTASSTSLDDLLLLSLSIPLTENQAKTVKKKVNTLRSTIVKQKGSKRGQEVVQIVNNSKQRPDVRSLFTKSEYASAQTIDIPKSDVSEKDGNTISSQKYNLEIPNLIRRRSSSPDLSHEMVRERTLSTPPDYGKFKPIDSDLMTEQRPKINTKNLLSINKSTSNLKKETSRFSWSGYKKAFKVKHDRRNSHSILDSETNNTGIEMLSLKYNSSMRRQEISPQNSPKNNRQSNDQSVNDHYDSDYVTAEGLGLVIQMNETKVITDLRLNPFVQQLEDLSSDLQKKVRALATIELATVLDMYGLEYGKIKRRKFRKKFKKSSECGLFGVSLNDLYNRDKKRNNNCMIPSILENLISYIRVNGLHEEGIFRITGSQNRVQTLKEELEILYQYYYSNNLRESNEEVFALMNKYSIYDICSVLKHFIRELPDPLLTCELLEAYLLVPKIPDFLQQIKIINLLFLLTNESHRNTIEAILSLLNDIIIHEQLNKMTVHNISTIMAPNLFPNLIEKKVSKGGEQKEMFLMLERAKDSFFVTKMLINSQTVIFHVPPYLIGQIMRRKK